MEFFQSVNTKISIVFLLKIILIDMFDPNSLRSSETQPPSNFNHCNTLLYFIFRYLRIIVYIYQLFLFNSIINSQSKISNVENN